MAKHDVGFLREQATRFRRLAHEIMDERARRALLELAEEYEARADAREDGDEAGPVSLGG
jgi:hypothetical protein